MTLWQRLALLGLFSLAGLIYSLAWSKAPVRCPDTGGYLTVAADLADGKLDQMHGRTPGYPMLLLISGNYPQQGRSLFLLGLLFHFASIGLLASALARLTGTFRLVLVFACVAVLPPFAEHAAYVMTENLAGLCLAVLMWALVRWHQSRRPAWIVIAAAAITGAALTRPVFQLAWVMVSVMLLARGRLEGEARFSLRDARAALLVAVLTMGALGSYSLANYRKFGYFGITHWAGFNLSTRTVRVVEKLPDEFGDLREFLVERRNHALVEGSSHTAYQYFWDSREDMLALTGVSEIELARRMGRANLYLIKAQPLEYLHEVMKAAASYWLPAAGPIANGNSRLLQLCWVLVHFALVGIFGLTLMVVVSSDLYRAAAKMARSSVSSHPRLTTPARFALYSALALVVYTMAVSCAIDMGDSRQRVSTDLLILFITAVAAWSCWRSLRASEDGQTPAPTPELSRTALTAAT